jgi:hypothetical protein
LKTLNPQSNTKKIKVKKRPEIKNISKVNCDPISSFKYSPKKLPKRKNPAKQSSKMFETLSQSSP